jgi:hypothetical protein
MMPFKDEKTDEEETSAAADDKSDEKQDIHTYSWKGLE